MAGSKFTNEDPNVQVALRITVQVRADEITLTVQADPGVTYPTTTRHRVTAKRGSTGGAEDILSKALSKAAESLPAVLESLEGPAETW